jgi:hypothetical protein
MVEARRNGELFGEARLKRALDELGPDAGAEELLGRVAERCDRRPDDMAACVLGISGAAGAPVVREEELEVDTAELAGDRPEQFLLACGVAPSAIPRILDAAATTVDRSGAAVLSVDAANASPAVRVTAHESEGLGALESASHEERTLP